MYKIVNFNANNISELLLSSTLEEHEKQGYILVGILPDHNNGIGFLKMQKYFAPVRYLLIFRKN